MPAAGNTTACFWRHRWGKWTDKTEGQKTRDGRVIGKIIVQERRCEVCNQVALRTEEAVINEW